MWMKMGKLLMSLTKVNKRTMRNCWKSISQLCGYKIGSSQCRRAWDTKESFLLMMIDKFKRLLEQIEEAKEKERIATQPLACIIPVSQRNTHKPWDYQSLKVTTVPWPLLEKLVPGCPEPNKPRTQKVKEPRKGTPCNVCQAKVLEMKNSMMEHYAAIHDQLLVGIHQTYA